MYRQEEIQRDCPVDECEGEVTYFTEEGENGPYADGSYQTWIYLMMSADDQQCSEGHTFSPDDVERMERSATESYQESLYCDEP